MDRLSVITHQLHILNADSAPKRTLSSRLPPTLPGLGVVLPVSRNSGEPGIGERVRASGVRRAASLVIPDAVDTFE